jgi:hypothetical protein
LLNNRRSPFDEAQGERRLFDRIAKIPFMLSLSKHGIYFTNLSLGVLCGFARKSLFGSDLFHRAKTPRSQWVQRALDY